MLRAYAPAAVSVGLTAPAVREVVLQAGLYTGFGNAETCLAAVNAVLGQPAEDEAGGLGPDDDLLEAGVSLMEALHGERARAGYASGAGAPAALYDLAIRYGYGALWHRPPLSRRDRLLTAVSVFASLEQHGQLVKFSAAALRAGVTAAEVHEAVMQVAPYCGFPRSLNALVALDGSLPAGGG